MLQFMCLLILNKIGILLKILSRMRQSHKRKHPFILDMVVNHIFQWKAAADIMIHKEDEVWVIRIPSLWFDFHLASGAVTRTLPFRVPNFRTGCTPLARSQTS